MTNNRRWQDLSGCRATNS